MGLVNEPQPQPDYVYQVTLIRVIDGDTCVLSVDLGMRVHVTIPVRLYGCNAPEHGTPAGDAATANLVRLLSPLWRVRPPLTARTFKPTAGDGLEKFGRWLAEIFLPDGTNVALQQIADGHAVTYTGGTR